MKVTLTDEGRAVVMQYRLNHNMLPFDIGDEVFFAEKHTDDTLRIKSIENHFGMDLVLPKQYLLIMS